MQKKVHLATSKAKKLLRQAKAMPVKEKLLWLGLPVAIVAAGIGMILYGSTPPKTVTQLPAETPACSLPKVDFKESAFSIGVPDGWIHEVNNGTVSIMEDESNTTAAFLYTARLEREVSASHFLTEFADVFDNAITNAGGQFSLGPIAEEGQVATAHADATVEEGNLTGQFQVDKDNDFVTLKVYWAPVEQFNEKEPILKDVVGCFDRHKVIDDEILAAASNYSKSDTPVELQQYNGNYFKLLLPSDYIVTGETDSGIDVSQADNQAGFSYAYVTGAQGPYTPQSWAENTLPQAGIGSAQMGNATSIPSPIEGYTIEEFDFTGTLSGATVQGKITVGIYNTPDFGFGQSSSAFTAIQIAKQDIWPEVSSTLQQIQNSVEITDIGSRANVALPPNRPIESVGESSITSSYEYSSSVSDRAHENWSEAMRGYETAESPSTFDKYDVPLNSWNPSGPEGPGYYRALPGGGLEKLSQE